MIPVEGGLRLVFDGVAVEPVRVRVYNLSGVCVYEKKEADHTTPPCGHPSYSGGETDTSEAFVTMPCVASGVYVVQVETADRRLQGSTLIRF